MLESGGHILDPIDSLVYDLIKDNPKQYGAFTRLQNRVVLAQLNGKDFPMKKIWNLIGQGISIRANEKFNRLDIAFDIEGTGRTGARGPQGPIGPPGPSGDFTVNGLNPNVLGGIIGAAGPSYPPFCSGLAGNFPAPFPIACLIGPPIPNIDGAQPNGAYSDFFFTRINAGGTNLGNVPIGDNIAGIRY